MITAANFRADVPAFASSAIYPDTSINFWLALASKLVLAPPWDDTVGDDGSRSVRDVGLEMFVAHNLALEQQSANAARKGAVPGLSGGVMSSKSVGPVSASYDVAAGIVKDAGFWNLTIYGVRFVWLYNMIGAGPIQVGIGVDPMGSLNGPAWPGPWPWPSQTGFSS